MGKLVFVLPGFLGSEILTATPVSLIWVQYGALAAGRLTYFELSPDGITPLPPNGRGLLSGEPLPSYYDKPLKLLSQQMADDRYTVIPVGYDWRLDFRIVAVEVADQIRGLVTAAEPATIVGHSAGGLLARAIWAELDRTGETDLIRRIVTIGSPHYGTYNVPNTWNLNGDTMSQLWWLNHILGSQIITTTFLSKADIRRISATWPACYQLLPVVGAPDAGDDPLRLTLFDAGKWPVGSGISPIRLAEAKDVWGPFLLSQAATPPPWILTTVAGVGVPTPFKVINPDRFGFADSIGTTEAGDGTCTEATALMPGSAQVSIPSQHMDMPQKLVASGKLRELILDVRVAPDPAPAEEFISGDVWPNLTVPPMPTMSGMSSTAGVCGRGKCHC